MEALTSALPFGLLLAALVAAVAVSDMRRMTIPDPLNLLLAAGGFAFQLWRNQMPAYAVLMFPAALFLGFLALRLWFARSRGTAGLGLGDVKMAGASAFWISPWNLTLYLLFSCTGALLFVLYLYLRGGRIDLKMKVPFGPFLGLGLMVTWVLENSGFPTLVPDGSS